MVCTTGIIASTLASIFAKEYATGINHLVGKLYIIVSCNDEMFGCICVANLHSIVGVVHKYNLTVVECFCGYIASWQYSKLLVYLNSHLLHHIGRRAYQQYL